MGLFDNSEKVLLLGRAQQCGNRANKVRSISMDANQASKYLREAINLSDGEWKGNAADSFRERIEELIRDCDRISYKAINTANKISRFSEELENKALNMGSSEDGEAGDGSFGGGGSGGGIR